MVFDVLLGRHGPGGIGDHVGRTNLVGEVVVDRRVRQALHGHALAVEEHVLVRDGAAGVALDHRGGAGAKPIELGGSRDSARDKLGDALTRAIVVVSDAAGGVGPILGIILELNRFFCFLFPLLVLFLVLVLRLFGY